MTAPRLELLDDRPTPLDLRVRIETGRHCKCGSDIAIVGRGRGLHADLACVGCGAHRGWLSDSTLNWINLVMRKFGAPPTPIVLRRRRQTFRASAREQSPDNSGKSGEHDE
jgi:hypothetical protein